MSWYEELDRWTADYLPDMIYEHDAERRVLRQRRIVPYIMSGR